MASSNVEDLVARCYSLDELLDMRTSLPIVSCVINKLNHQSAIEPVIRLPKEAFKDPEHFSTTTKDLLDHSKTFKREQPQNYRSISHSGEALTSNDDDPIEQLVRTAPSIRDHQRVQWHFRRRDISDCSGQPHSAPTCVAAQQSENFQRFYRAVVSPTHVRVTAGGRIVPNTRTTASSAFEWNGGESHFEQRNQLPEKDLEPIQFSPWFHSTNVLPANVPLTSGPPPLVPAFPPVYPFVPGPRPIALPAMAPHDQHSLTPPLSSTAIHDFSQLGDAAPGSVQPEQIQISPPSQFDQSKPFIFNGHWVYPVPQGFPVPANVHPIPITMLGYPNSLPQGYFPPPISAASMIVHPLNHPPLMLPTGIGSLENSLPVASQAQPQTLPPISELTKLQLQHLRGYLNGLEHQAANGRHQIHEGYVEQQRKAIKQQIEQMEITLEGQLAEENDESSDRKEANSKMSRHSTFGGPLHEEKQNDLTVEGQNVFAGIPQLPAHASTKDPPKNLSFQTGETSGTNSSSRPEPARRSRLSAAAAMAPPFQPRAQAIAASSTNILSGSELTNIVPKVAESKDQIITQSIHRSTVDRHPSSHVDTPGPPSLPKANSMYEPQMQTQVTALPLSFQRAKSFNGQSGPVASPTRMPIISPQPVPYLIGAPPQGMKASEVQSDELIYPRPLTAEELRARHLYWGKAPRSVQSGLPKFDGKDFYPPSPAKETARPIINSQAPSSNATFFERDIRTPDFSNLFMDYGASRNTTPVTPHCGPSIHSGVPDPTQVFLENGIIGYRSPSPRPSTYKYEALSLPNWSRNAPGGSGSKSLPRATNSDSNGINSPAFSQLFKDENGNKALSPDRIEAESSQAKLRANGRTVAPNNKMAEEKAEAGSGETRSLDSWGLPASSTQWIPEDSAVITSIEPMSTDSQSSSSTVEFILTPNPQDASPKRAGTTTFAERVANISSTDQQSQFLQNMLKNTAQVAQAVSGTVSSTTAQGYLPQYHGSAAASLAPAITNIATSDRESERITNKTQSTGVAPLIAANFLPENRPLNRDRTPRPIRPSPETMGAGAYMRYVAQKAEADKKVIEQGWNANTTGMGPVMGSDW